MTWWDIFLHWKWSWCGVISSYKKKKHNLSFTFLPLFLTDCYICEPYGNNVWICARIWCTFSVCWTPLFWKIASFWRSNHELYHIRNWVPNLKFVWFLSDMNYLSPEQALADYAHFLDWFIASMNLNNPPVISFGGSYHTYSLISLACYLWWSTGTEGCLLRGLGWSIQEQLMVLLLEVPPF